jgi:putative MATE family efflux protein
MSYPALAIYNSCAALFRSTGNSKVPMRIAFMVNVINIGGNAFFLFVLHMGVAGVALSTLLSRIAAAAALLVLLVKDRYSPVSLAGISKVKIVPSMLRRILNIGIPTGLENSMFQVGRLLTQRIFAVFGTSVMAANAVAAVINSMSFMPGNAFGIAILTIVGQCVGAGDYESAKKFTGRLIKLTWITIFVISISILIFRASLLGFFNLSEEAKNTAKLFLTLHCVSMAIGWTFSFALPNALRAAGDAKYTMVVGSASMWIVRVLGAYFFTFVMGMGPAGVWLAMGCDFISRGASFMLRWRSGKWRKNKVISE